MEQTGISERKHIGRRWHNVPSLADQAYKRIEEMIVILELEPGVVYTEKRISDALGLGRTPVRDAILRLEQDQLLTVIPRQGVLILPLDFERDLLALDLRAVVERLIVERATKLASDIERRRLVRMAEEMERAAKNMDILEFTRIDDAFHDFVADCAHQPFAAKVLAPLHSMSRRAGTLYYRDARVDERIREAAIVHVRLMRAIANQDVDGALAAGDALLARSRKVFVELAENQDF